MVRSFYLCKRNARSQFDLHLFREKKKKELVQVQFSSRSTTIKTTNRRQAKHLISDRYFTHFHENIHNTWLVPIANALLSSASDVRVHAAFECEVDVILCWSR